MTIYNVLIKGVEVTDITYCRAFTSFELATEFAEEFAKRRQWVGKSILHGGTAWVEYNNLDDIRFEDATGNTYYAVIYKQELT